MQYLFFLAIFPVLQFLYFLSWYLSWYFEMRSFLAVIFGEALLQTSRHCIVSSDGWSALRIMLVSACTLTHRNSRTLQFLEFGLFIALTYDTENQRTPASRKYSGASFWSAIIVPVQAFYKKTSKLNAFLKGSSVSCVFQHLYGQPEFYFRALLCASRVILMSAK